MRFIEKLEKIQRSLTYSLIAILCMAFTFYSSIKSIFIYLNWIPGYYVEWHRTDSIMPIVNLFPGQKIRFDMGFYDSFPEQNIVSAKWEIIRGNDYFGVNEIKPTFILPPAKGGAYRLRVEATTLDGKIKKGESALYVVQDEPIAVKLTSPAQVRLTTKDAPPALLKDIQSKGVEVYSGHGQWTKVQNVSASKDSVTFALQPNESVSLYGNGNQMLFRAQNAVDKLTNYGSTQFPHDAGEMRTQDAK